MLDGSHPIEIVIALSVRIEIEFLLLEFLKAGFINVLAGLCHFLLHNMDGFVGKLRLEGNKGVDLGERYIALHVVLMIASHFMIDASVINTDSFTVSFKFEDIAQNICLDVILKAIRDLGVNPPDVDEFIIEARITGIPEIYRESRIHALNQKEVALRYAKSINKKEATVRSLLKRGRDILKLEIGGEFDEEFKNSRCI